MAGPTAYTTLNAYTREYIDKTMYDAIFNATPVVQKFTANQRPYPGGDKIQTRIEYARNPNAKWISGAEAWTNAKHEFATKSELSPKVFVVPVTLLQDDLDACKGRDEMLADLMEGALANARNTFRYYMTSGIFADGTGTGGKELTGLAAMCDDGTNIATYAGIPRLTYTWFAGKYTALADYISYDAMNSMLGQLTDGEEKPDLIITHQGIWDDLWELALPSERGNSGLRRNIGAQELTLRGIGILVDAQCPTDRVYFLNSKYLKLRPHADYAKLKFSGWKKPLDQRTLVSDLQWVGNAVCTNPRYQGVIDTITT